MAEFSNPLDNKNKFKLGLFAINCASGLAETKVNERWLNSWENNLKIAQLADEAGLEYLLPLGRWKGYDGETHFHSNVLESISWASALLATTRQIGVISTIHTSLHNPVILAKQLATMDHIGGGRVGLNMVCGWNRQEYEALGGELLYSHQERYQHAQEWIDIIKKLWQTETPFDWNSQFFKFKKVYSFPLPLQKNIPIFNGAGSNIGKDFAVRNVDYLFMLALDLNQLRQDIISIKKQAKLQKRKKPLKFVSYSYVVCRPTYKEAEEYLHYYSQENADWEAVDHIVKLLANNSKIISIEELKLYRFKFPAGHGGYPLIGTPDDIANGIEQLYNAGLAGTALTFVNYLDEFPYFRDEVLPRLQKRGLREHFDL